jgi:hypothetical protein
MTATSMSALGLRTDVRRPAISALLSWGQERPRRYCSQRPSRRFFSSGPHPSTGGAADGTEFQLPPLARGLPRVSCTVPPPSKA